MKKKDGKFVILSDDELSSDDDIEVPMYKESTICCLYRLLRILRGGYTRTPEVELEKIDIDDTRAPAV